MRSFRTGISELVGGCPHMARLHGAVGAPRSRKRSPGFGTLVRVIVDQQVSVQAGAAIWAKLEQGLGVVAPETVMSAGDAKLRDCGLSRAKARYVACLAAEIVEGRLDLVALGRKRNDEFIRARLTAVPGIGDWTADIYLMFALGRADVWPAGDLALAVACQRLLALKERPSPKDMIGIGERWRPWRSVAALMLWHFYKRVPAEFE